MFGITNDIIRHDNEKTIDDPTADGIGNEILNIFLVSHPYLRKDKFVKC
jgi:hypothetical protein